MPGIGIITNPNSRRNRRHPDAVRRLGYVLGSDDDRHELTQRPADIAAVAERFKAQNVDVLALNGGDGTNHMTLTSFIEVYGDQPLPKIAFLRGGTMNTISNGVGVRGTPGTILMNISEKYHLGKPFQLTERPILKIEELDSDTTHYGFIFGNGFIQGFLEVYYDDPNPSPPVAAKLVARSVASSVLGTDLAKKMFAPLRATVTVDGEVWAHEEYSAVVASSIEQIGLGFRPFTRCRQQRGAFNVLGILCGPLGFAMQLPKIRLGMPVAPEKICSEVATEVTFESPNPIKYTIDGDLHTAVGGRLRLSSGPLLRIIVG